MRMVGHVPAGAVEAMDKVEQLGFRICANQAAIWLEDTQRPSDLEGWWSPSDRAKELEWALEQLRPHQVGIVTAVYLWAHADENGVH